MSENIRGNIESKKQENTAMLESKKQENTKANTINAESSTLKSNDANNEARLDSNNDEIVYEIWHKIGWWNGIWMTIFFLFGSFVIYCAFDAIYDPLLDAKGRISLIIFAIFFGVPLCLLMIRCAVFMRRNRFYITHQGMGFERQHWFRMQRGFYRFGEVGVMITTGGMKMIEYPTCIVIFPLGEKWRRLKCLVRFEVYCCGGGEYLSPKLYNEITEQSYLKDFLIKKTKEALEAQNVDIDTLCYDLDKQFVNS